MDTKISKIATNNYKVILAILIFLHHLAKTTQIDFLYPFVYFGSPCVSVFLFLSGYGLMLSYQHRGEKYLDDFFSHRMLGVILPFLIAILCYQLLQYFILHVPAADIFASCRRGSTIKLLPNAWYIFLQIYFYLAFFFSYRYLHRPIHQTCSVFLFTILYCAIIYWLGFGAFWVFPSFCFLYGILLANKQLTNYTAPKKLIIIAGVFMIFALAVRLLVPSLSVAIQCLFFYPAICLCTLSLHQMLDKFVLPSYLVTRSYHIYIVQAFSITLLYKSSEFLQSNLVWYFISAFMVEIVATEILYQASLRGQITNLYKDVQKN